MGQLASKNQLIWLAQTIKQAYTRKDDILEDGLIKSSLLPSYVDDVLEYAKKSSFPASGESGKIYVALDTNLTYRWSGTAYVEISKSLALGETSATAYAGDKGKANADNIATLLGYFSSGITKAQLADAVQTSLGKADTAYQKPSTGIPKTDLASAVQTSLGKADTALQSHQTIYTLTIQRNGTQVDTYTPNSAAKTININAVTSITVPTGFSAGSLAAGGSLAISFASGYSLPTTAAQTGWTNAKNLFEAMFERVGSGTTADPYIIRAKYGFYSDSFVSAGGLNPNAGGGGGGDVLGIKFGDDTIIGSTEGVLYVTSIPMAIINGLDSALGGKQDTISDLATIRSGAASGATAVQSVKIGDTEYKSGVNVVLPAYPTTLPASNTTDTYSATGTAPVSGKAVASAISGSIMTDTEFNADILALL